MTNTPVYKSDIVQLLQEADAIDTPDENTVYLGFCAPGTTGTDAAKWSICKLTTTGNVTLRQWANGSNLPRLIFDNRATYTYTFKNF